VKDAITPPSYFSMNHTLYLVHSKTCLLSIASPFIQRGTGESDVRDKKERQILGEASKTGASSGV
jgi:hypothetical protein